MCHTTKILRIIAFCIIPCCTAAAPAALIWPATPQGWTPITVGGAPYVDPLYTGSGSDYYATPPSPDKLDLVGGIDKNGNGPFATGFWATDGANLMFRMRVDSNPTQGNDNTNHVWTVLLNTDADPAVDWAMQLDAQGDNQVEFVRALAGSPSSGTPWNPVTLAGTPHTGLPLAAWSAFVNASALPLNAPYGGSHFDSTNANDDDFFVDIALPISLIQSIMAQAGETWSGQFSAAFATSADHININKDLPDITTWPDPVPEPASLSLLAAGALATLRRRRH